MAVVAIYNNIQLLITSVVVEPPIQRPNYEIYKYPQNGTDILNRLN